MDIDECIEDLNENIWDRGYQKEVNNGIWYELYVNDEIKEMNPKLDPEDFQQFKKLDITNYEDYNQITFFSPFKDASSNLTNLEDLLS